MIVFCITLLNYYGLFIKNAAPYTRLPEMLCAVA